MIESGQVRGRASDCDPAGGGPCIADWPPWPAWRSLETCTQIGMLTSMEHKTWPSAQWQSRADRAAAIHASACVDIEHASARAQYGYRGLTCSLTSCARSAMWRWLGTGSHPARRESISIDMPCSSSCQATEADSLELQAQTGIYPAHQHVLSARLLALCLCVSSDAEDSLRLLETASRDSALRPDGTGEGAPPEAGPCDTRSRRSTSWGGAGAGGSSVNRAQGASAHAHTLAPSDEQLPHSSAGARLCWGDGCVEVRDTAILLLASC